MILLDAFRFFCAENVSNPFFFSRYKPLINEGEPHGWNCQLSDAGFDGEWPEVGQSLLLVEFFGPPWCGPLPNAVPRWRVDEFGQGIRRQNIKVGKLNTDENVQVATRYKLSRESSPVSSSFKGGKSVDPASSAYTPSRKFKKNVSTPLLS